MMCLVYAYLCLSGVHECTYRLIHDIRTYAKYRVRHVYYPNFKHLEDKKYVLDLNSDGCSKFPGTRSFFLM